MNVKEPKRLRDLVRLLDAMRALYAELVGLAKVRLDAMRCADLALMAQLDEREAAATRRLQEREGLRKQLMDAIGEELGVRSGRTMTVSDLASRFAAQPGSVLHLAADSLRSVVAELAQLNRVVGLAAREVVHHMSWVFAAVRPKAPVAGGYAAGGSPVGETGRIFEFVG
jgi:hypothetical protein